MRSDKRKAKNKKRRIVILIVILLIVAGAAGFWQHQLTSVSGKSEEVIFSVKPGQTRDQVLENLKKQGLIRDEKAAKLYAKLSGKESYLAGNFSLMESMNTKVILSTLTDKKQVKDPGEILTFPEGVTAEREAEIIASKTQFTKDEILAKWNDREYIESLEKKYDFITEDIFKSQKVYLEGYLMPSTYFITEKMGIEDITEMILDNFDKVIKKNRKEIRKDSMSLHDIITFASIVQGEAPHKKDMVKVAGVFMNRLNEGMDLGSSVTVKYAMDGEESWRRVEASSHIDSDYNTYRIQGLPPGPVNNPGEEAIEAVLHPEKTEYLYFLADVKKDGTIYYSKTLEEHEQKKAKYLGD